MIRGETYKTVICLTDGLTLTGIAQALGDKFEVSLFDDKDKNDEDILIVGKKKG